MKVIPVNFMDICQQDFYLIITYHLQPYLYSSSNCNNASTFTGFDK